MSQSFEDINPTKWVFGNDRPEESRTLRNTNTSTNRVFERLNLKYLRLCRLSFNGLSYSLIFLIIPSFSFILLKQLRGSLPDELGTCNYNVVLHILQQLNIFYVVGLGN